MPESNDPTSMSSTPEAEQQNAATEEPQAIDSTPETAEQEPEVAAAVPEAEAAPEPVEAAAVQQPIVQQTAVIPQQPGQQPPAGSQQQEVKDTVPLVLGILSIVFAGIVGLILSIIGMNKSKQVLNIAPNSSKAKGGRICSIIGLVFSILAIIGVIAAFALGFSLFGGDTAQARQAADSTLKEVVTPDSTGRADFVSSFESGMGIGLSDLGITSDEFASWLFDSNSYTITGVSMNSSNGKSTATVTASVNARSLADMEANLENMDTSKFATATTVDQYYKILGDAIKDAMSQTQASNKTVTLTLTKSNGTWTVDSGVAEDIATTIYTE